VVSPLDSNGGLKASYKVIGARSTDPTDRCDLNSSAGSALYACLFHGKIMDGCWSTATPEVYVYCLTSPFSHSLVMPDAGPARLPYGGWEPPWAFQIDTGARCTAHREVDVRTHFIYYSCPHNTVLVDQYVRTSKLWSVRSGTLVHGKLKLGRTVKIYKAWYAGPMLGASIIRG
jgi:hypothetical protein